MSNHTPAPQNAQPAQGENWELVELKSTFETISRYATPTGHNVTVHTINHEASSHVHIVVSDATGFYNASNAYFDGVNHDIVSSNFADNYLQSSELKRICKCFDEICLEFGDIPAA